VHLLNKVSPVDLIGGMPCVHSIRPLKEGMEEVSVTTLGLKNVNVARELEGVALPRELFTMDVHRKQLEALVHEHVPQLAGKIVVDENHLQTVALCAGEKHPAALIMHAHRAHVHVAIASSAVSLQLTSRIGDLSDPMTLLAIMACCHLRRNFCARPFLIDIHTSHKCTFLI
jgi:hypothetical protein